VIRPIELLAFVALAELVNLPQVTNALLHVVIRNMARAEAAACRSVVRAASRPQELVAAVAAYVSVSLARTVGRVAEGPATICDSRA
jgi:hypothetical protein